jgi:hypothetical protein
MAEDARFELARVLPQHAFQACALGHYANPPSRRIQGPPTPHPAVIMQFRPPHPAVIMQFRPPHPAVIMQLLRARRAWLDSLIDPSCGATPLNSPRAGRQQG